MSFTKKDRNIRSISGKDFQSDKELGRIGASAVANAIASALHRTYGGSGSARKTVVGLTAANERAVKNWFEGRNGPSAGFLITLCRHSDDVLEAVLNLAGRRDLLAAKKLVDAKNKLREMLSLLDEIEGK